MKQIRAVILDYGLVLCRKPLEEDINWMANTFGVSHERFWQLYEKNRQSFDKGDLNPLDYWSAFASDAGIQLHSASLEQLQDLDIKMWGRLEKPLIEWTQLIKANGYKTALLSNMHLRFARYIRENCSWLQIFDCPIFSAELNLIKPDPKIFHHALEGLGVEASAALFIDDRMSNIHAARSLGIAAIQYTTLIELNHELRELGFPYLVAIG